MWPFIPKLKYFFCVYLIHSAADAILLWFPRKRGGFAPCSSSSRLRHLEIGAGMS